MGTTRWVIVSFVALAAVFALVSLASEHAGRGPELTVRGSLPEFRPGWVRGWQAVGSIPAEASGTGEVLDIAEDDDAIYVLQRDRWYRLTAGGAEGPHGWLAEGGPEALTRAASIAYTDGVVYVLDTAASEVRGWAPDGRHVGHMPLRPSAPFAFLRPERIEVDRQGRVHLSTLAVRSDGSATWVLLRYPARAFVGDGDTLRSSGGRPTTGEAPIEQVDSGDAMEPDTLFQASADAAHGVFAEPKYSLSADGGVVLRVATEDELQWLDADGRTVRTATRRDSPAWPVPDSIRVGYRQVLAAMPSERRAAYELPGHFPPVRDLVAHPDGHVLVLLNAGSEDLHVEVLNELGEPRGRLTDRSQPEPVFVTPRRLYRVRHELDNTRIEALRFHIPG